MLLYIHPDNPADRQLNTVIECLKSGGIIIIPTDTVYAMVCDLKSKKAAERMANIKGLKIEKAKFSFIFNNLSHISDYTQQFDNTLFKLLKRNLPGAFTFILNANNNVPKLFKNKKRTVGIRVPNNRIPEVLVEMLGNPLLATSIRDEDEIIEYTTDPELIHEKYKDQVDMVIDGGIGRNVASTIVDCTSGEIEITRQGLGQLNLD